MIKVFVCKQSLCERNVSKMMRQCAVKDCGNGDYALEKWKKTYCCSICALSRICTYGEPFR